MLIRLQVVSVYDYHHKLHKDYIFSLSFEKYRKQTTEN